MHKLGARTPHCPSQQPESKEKTYAKLHQWTPTRSTEFAVKQRAAAVIHLVDSDFVLAAFE